MCYYWTCRVMRENLLHVLFFCFIYLYRLVKVTHLAILSKRRELAENSWEQSLIFVLEQIHLVRYGLTLCKLKLTLMHHLLWCTITVFMLFPLNDFLKKEFGNCSFNLNEGWQVNAWSKKYYNSKHNLSLIFIWCYFSESWASFWFLNLVLQIRKQYR